MRRKRSRNRPERTILNHQDSIRRIFIDQALILRAPAALHIARERDTACEMLHIFAPRNGNLEAEITF
jgi:hypothetical protein